MIPSNSTIGVFGSGQLGRMFAIEARKMGYRVRTYSPANDTPTGQIADYEIEAEYTDIDRVREFARSVDVVTFEFENVPSATVEAAAALVRVHPKGEILHTTQNRLREKTFLRKHGFPVAPYSKVGSLEDLEKAVRELGTPAVLKTAGFGYDGKGQVRISSGDECSDAFRGLGGNEGVFEAFIDFRQELSVVAARDEAGAFAHYGVIGNVHANHILDISHAPAEVPGQILETAVGITRGIADELGYVGTLCVEFFLTAGNELLVNEIAPRPHNSGHLTFDAAITSQFEQQLRAVCGLGLGSTRLLRPAAMANLLGEIWDRGEPEWGRVLEHPGIKLHLYGKTEARKGRKMGHLTALADSAEQAVGSVLSAREAVSPSLSQARRQSIR